MNTRTEQVIASMEVITNKVEEIPDDATNEQMALILNAATIDMLQELNMTFRAVR